MIYSWLVALVKMKQTKGELSGSLVSSDLISGVFEFSAYNLN